MSGDSIVTDHAQAGNFATVGYVRLRMDVGLNQSAAMADRRAALLAAVADTVPAIAGMAGGRDADGAFPSNELDLLRHAGALACVVPVALGGLGLSTDPDAAVAAMELLRLIGQASLPLARVFEGHLNAIRLVCRLGTPDQARASATDARGGHLFGVWNTDPADQGLAIDRGCLAGAKILASGAGFVTRALVTAAGEPRPLLLVRLEIGERADLAGWTAQGMRASATGRVDFSGLGADRVDHIGPPGAYLRQPDFSGGAWRVLAAQLGGLDALMDAFRDGLAARGRDGDPLQRSRLGAALVAQETAHLFVSRAAELAEAAHPLADEVVAYVGLARTALESACMEAMRLAQRSLGLQAFMRPAPIERICRDLGTYLRQPAADEVLNEAAAWFTRHDLPRQVSGCGHPG